MSISSALSLHIIRTQDPIICLSITSEPQQDPTLPHLCSLLISFVFVARGRPLGLRRIDVDERGFVPLQPRFSTFSALELASDIVDRFHGVDTERVV